jgi:polyphosphate kinase
MNRKKSKSKKKQVISFKSFEKIPSLERVQIKGRTYETRKYFNRDMSWLSFNERVLFEAIGSKNPLLERLRFLDIFRSNNDEFFMKRVSLLVSNIFSGDRRLSIDGKNSIDLYNEFIVHIKRNWDFAYTSFKNSICPELERSGVKFYTWNQLENNEQLHLKNYFRDHIFPILTPLAVDSGHPFPYLSNLSKSVGICLKVPNIKGRYFARVKIPTEIPQWINLKSTPEFNHRFINLEEVICNNLNDLFPGMKIDSQMIFRVTRDASLREEENSSEAEDVMEWVSEGLKERKFSPVVRLEVSDINSRWLIDFLKTELELQEEQVFPMNSVIGYTNFSEIININLPNLRFKPFVGEKYHRFLVSDHEENIFYKITKDDHLIHFPFESYASTVERFLIDSSNDSKVRAIKIVLYRTDADGRLIDILINAAEKGKQVAVVIELKARFDEERNIKWAQRLEDYGIHVTYGVKEYKTHAKMILVVRDEGGKLKTYVNIGTGNFNNQTSKLYTDLSYFTSDKTIGDDVVQIFNYLTGRCLEGEYKKLLISPFNMNSKFLSLIQNEIKNKKQGLEAEIIAKMNSLEDPVIIENLYMASQAGVKITLIVRGFCTLKPGVKDLSENIKVVSIVGRLLEHSRIYYFRSGAGPNEEGKFFIGSADWMSRNLHNRVEVVTPITKLNLKKKIWMILESTLKDNQNAWELNGKGEYKQKITDKNPFNVQNWLIENKKENV